MSKERSNVQAANDAKDRFIVRFHDAGQREVFKTRAAKNMRTMNAEILFLLEAGIKATDGVANSKQ